MQRCRRDTVCSELADLTRREQRHSTLAEQLIVLNRQGQLEACGYHTHGHCDEGPPCPLAWPDAGLELVAAVVRGERDEALFDYTTDDGSVRLASVVARKGGGATITHVDITARRRLEDRLRVAAALFDSAGEMHAAIDATGTVLLANAAAERALGRTAGSLLGVHVRELLADRFRSQNGEQIVAHLRRDGFWTGEGSLRTSTGATLPVWGTVRVVTDDASQPARFVATAGALQGVDCGADNLAAMALLDPLTGLRNRRALLEHLRFVLLRAERIGSQVGVLFLDLDDFKAINDSLGHEVGDDVLRQVGARLLGVLRSNDLCARIGGDEFTIVVEDLRSAAALALVRGKVMQALWTPIAVQGRVLPIAASIGSASARGGGQTAEELLAAADKSMYRVKRRRQRNRGQRQRDRHV